MFFQLLLETIYPESYPSENNPKTGSFKTNLKKIWNHLSLDKTTLYKIEKDLEAVAI